MNTRAKLRCIFREWWNDYLTIQKIAEDYDISPERAYRIINIGRRLHNKRADQLRKIVNEQ
jgi:hypothetical protein